MIIKFTTAALMDVSDLRVFLSPKSETGLEHVLSVIEQTVFSIPNSISKGRKTPRDDVFEKITPKYGYVIPYYIRSNTIYILRVYHSSRKDLDYNSIIQLD